MKHKKEGNILMNLSKKLMLSLLSAFLLVSCAPQKKEELPPTQPEEVTPAEKEGLSPEQQQKLQIDEDEVMTNPPG